MIPFPKKKYSVIYADPPWNYAAGGKTRNVERHYRTMKPEDIYSLPVQDVAEDDCLLFLWATFPNLDVALETIRRWGFQYKTAAFVWVKRNRKSPSWFWGLGNWTRANAEICLLATKGKPKRASASVHSIIDAPIVTAKSRPKPVTGSFSLRGGINDRTICKKDRPWLGFLGRRSGKR